MKNHNLTELMSSGHLLVERRPVRDRDSKPVSGLHNFWITLNNPNELDRKSVV